VQVREPDVADVRDQVAVHDVAVAVLGASLHGAGDVLRGPPFEIALRGRTCVAERQTKGDLLLGFRTSPQLERLGAFGVRELAART
jgi:hypothetical protein